MDTKNPRLILERSHPRKIENGLIYAELPGVAINEVCLIRSQLKSTEHVAKAVVVGIDKELVTAAIIGRSDGLSINSVLIPTGKQTTIETGYHMLGAVIDATGEITERLSLETTGRTEERVITGTPPDYKDRCKISTPLHTGIRAIDGVLTCGIGQRTGIFSTAGGGKSSLIHMMTEHVEADVILINLIGERGREVTEFVEHIRNSDIRERSILVYATSDNSAVERKNAALIATTIAEFFRDEGKNVVIFVDSLTRYARALRDVALASGQPPSRRGYPASVFDSLPNLLERPGITRRGSITAFYTILVEDDESNDPLAEEIRSILDGHIVLSRKLAGQGHYPAIDVLQSTSRVFGQVCEPEHREKAFKIRALMTRLEELQLLIDLGEYRPGENSENDDAVELRGKLEQWLCQPLGEYVTFEATLRSMDLFAQNH
ncbi:TPA: type III secretion system ATPase SctN [Salmonella enterica]|nr:type III secretion system ATPase SctN [Salmonella enterica]HEA0268602.1 type III secretion system ATPase SctN [Salmonella enterica]HEA0295539.1 type III secretion system ATPase SctN [Salmonella enterica]HEA0304648.1 type III secretion system ATPase SctN [Salmonella enterica]HEA0336852.1 type III secretion system ATPase SctN [Salmonella enterica]